MINVSKLALAAALAGGLLLAQPALADDGAAMKPAASKGEEHVDKRIKELHEKLKITADEQPQWDAFVKVMRENETTIHDLVEARHANETSTAVDDLKSYKEIADAHAAGLGKEIPAFEDLYSKMTPDQKANADDVFRTYEGHDHKAATAK
jgi:protein CpxP